MIVGVKIVTPAESSGFGGNWVLTQLFSFSMAGERGFRGDELLNSQLFTKIASAQSPWLPADNFFVTQLLVGGWVLPLLLIS